MTIVNVTRGTILATRAERAGSFWTRGKGLIGREGLPIEGALMLHPCASVHALFLSFPLDVIHLDHAGCVLRVFCLRPWHVGPVVRGSRTVIELPSGMAARTGTVVGDLIAWREPDNARVEAMASCHIPPS